LQASEQETTAHQTGTAIINPRRGVAKEKPLFYSSLKDKQSLEKKMAKFITTVKKSVIKQELDDVYADHLKLQVCNSVQLLLFQCKKRTELSFTLLVQMEKRLMHKERAFEFLKFIR